MNRNAAAPFKALMNPRRLPCECLARLAARALMPLAVLGLMVALAGCGDTEGVSSAFEKANTNNFDFTQYSINTGNRPIGLATGTFGGVFGFAVTNYLSGTVSVYLQDAVDTPSFTRRDYSVGEKPTQIRIAPLHGEADHPDIVLIAESGGNSRIVVLRNDGAESFSISTNYNAGEIVQQVEPVCIFDPCGDFLDLVISVPHDDEVRIFENSSTGDATFSVTTVEAGKNTGRFTHADFNGDGHTDLAVTLPEDDTVRVMLGDGNGNFTGTNYNTANYPIVVAAAVFRGGEYGLVVSGRDDDAMTFRMWNGSTFVHQFESGADNPETILIDSFTPNGPDFVVVDRHKDWLTYYLNNGSDHFTRYRIKSSEDPFDLASGNFSSDPDPGPDFVYDFVAVELKDRILAVFSGDGTGNFQRTQIGYLSQVTQPHTVRYCGSTRDDLLLVQSYEDRVLLLCNVSP